MSIVLGVLAWFGLSTVAGLVIGRVIRHRDEHDE